MRRKYTRAANNIPFLRNTWILRRGNAPGAFAVQ